MEADIPKQYMEVGGKPVISYCIETLSSHPGIDKILIVADEKWHEKIKKWLADADAAGKFCEIGRASCRERV